MEITKQVLLRFFELADQFIRGKFVVVGGSVMHLIDVDVRTTLDIDLANLEPEKSDHHAIDLMEIAVQLGLPVEAVNQAAAFFLYKMSHWQQCLVEVFVGNNCIFYRPNASLFIKLKINRLSESDLADCLHMIKFAKKVGENIDRKDIAQYLEKTRSSSQGQDYQKRLKALVKALKI